MPAALQEPFLANEVSEPWPVAHDTTNMEEPAWLTTAEREVKKSSPSQQRVDVASPPTSVDPPLDTSISTEGCSPSIPIPIGQEPEATEAADAADAAGSAGSWTHIDRDPSDVSVRSPA